MILAYLCVVNWWVRVADIIISDYSAVICYTALMITFELPDEFIAQEPAQPRDSARMLVYNRKTKQITDDYFYNLLDHLPDPTCMVVNNSKVEHCRMLFNEGRREIFVLESANNKTVRALVRPGKVFRLGKTVELTPNVSVTVTAQDEDGIRTLEFSENTDHPDLVAAQHVPLPPYIAQNDALAEEYQTMYAKDSGSKAAPTAGLHFTSELIKKVTNERDWAEVTLHVGLGTFASLTDEQLQLGRLHEEQYEIDQQTAEKISLAKHVTAVGTTSVRTLESAANNYCAELGPESSTSLFEPGATPIKAVRASTDILIQPGYEFKRVNSLITNFHLPGTSLLLLVAAFLGSEEELMAIYSHAIAEKYRFYSFGDCMFIV
jgi:S-adenosylmethionine:tRNA ribosyltransferase-isomerase